MPDGRIEGPGRMLRVVALAEAANSESTTVVNFMVVVELKAQGKVRYIRASYFCGRARSCASGSLVCNNSRTTQTTLEHETKIERVSTSFRS